jgi:hypothetical protein
MTRQNATTVLATVGAIALMPAVCLAGFDFELRLSGQIDAAVTYPSLNGYPYNAVFGDFAGSLRVGYEVSMVMNVTVDDNQQMSIQNLDGSVHIWTFGSTSGSSGIMLRHNRPFLLPGTFSEPYDTIQLQWGGFRQGPGGSVTISSQITLYGESGTLVSPDRRLIPTTLDEFVAAIDGAVLWINSPNSFLTGAFVTDPSYTIVPAPGVLLTLAGALAARRRRPARTTLPRRLPS